MKKSIMIMVLTAIAALIIPFQAVTEPSGNQSRNIELEVVQGAPYIRWDRNPFAKASVHSFSNEQEWNDELLVKYRGIVPLWLGSERHYAIYVTNKESPYEYDANDPDNNARVFFSSSYREDGTINAGNLPVGITTQTPVITVFIAAEDDDGRAFDPSQGDSWRLMFVGTSYKE